MGYDGSVKFDARIDTSKFKGDLQGLKSTASASFKAIGTAAVSMIGGISAAGISFESAFAGVKKTVNATAEELDALKNGIRDMAKETPATATEIAGIAESAGQLGIETKNILGFTRTMADLGVATNLAGEEAASTLAKFANITQMPQEQFSNLGSTIVALGNNLATTEADIAAMSLRLAGAGSQAGLSEADILAFSGALSSVGMEAQAGGSAFSKFITDMQLAVETGNKDLKNFAKVSGMSVADFKNAFKKDAAGAILSFIDGLNDTERNGKSATAVLDEMGITEINLSRALKSASEASDVFSNAVRLGNQAWSENTALTKEAEQRYATTESKLKMLGNQVTDLGITAWDSFSGPFASALDEGMNKMEELGQSMQSGELKSSLEGMGQVAGDLVSGLVSALEGAVPLISGLVSGAVEIGPALLGATAGVLAFKGAYTGLNAVLSVTKALQTASLGPLGLTALAIAGVTAAVVGVVAAVKSADDAFIEMGSEVEAAGEKYTEAKEKADITDDYAAKWRELNAAISSGSLTGQALADAESQRKDIEQWFIDNYGAYIDAEEQKNGIREETIGLIQEENALLSEQALLELQNASLEMASEIPDKIKEVETTRKNVDALESENKALLEQDLVLQKAINKWEKWDADSKTMQQNEDKRKEILGEVNDALGTNFTAIDHLDEKLKENKKTIKDNNEDLTDYKNKIDENTEAIQKYADGNQKIINSKLGMSLEDFADKYARIEQALADVESTGKIADTTMQGLKDHFPDIAEELENSDDPGKVLEDIMADLQTKIGDAKTEAEALGVELNGLPKDITIDIKLNTPTLPFWARYARGTKGAKEGPAIVNDGNGPELIESKDGSMRMVQSQGAALTWLNAGDRVYTAEQTRSILKKIPHYANGIGNSGVGYSITSGVSTSVSDVFLSKSFRGVGYAFAENIASGIVEGTKDVASASAEMGIAAANSFSEAASGSSYISMLKNGGAIRENPKGKTEKYDAEKEKLDYMKTFGLPDAEYYQELSKIRDEFLEEGTKEWYDATADIFGYQKSSAEDARDHAFSELERLYSRSLISEKEYLDKLLTLRDTYYAEGSEDWLNITDQVNDILLEREREALDKQYRDGLISAKEYYDGLTAIRDNWFAEGSSEWLAYSDEISEGLKSAIMDAYTDIFNYASDLIGEVTQKQEALFGQLKDYGKLTKTVRVDNWYENGDALEWTELKNFGKETEVLRKYKEDIEDVRSKLLSGGYDESFVNKFISQIAEMSVEEGAAYASLLSGSSSEDFYDYIAGYKDYLTEAEGISKYVFQEEFESSVDNAYAYLKKKLEEAGFNVPDHFLEIGKKAGASFGEGFGQQLTDLFAPFMESVSAFMPDYGKPIAAFNAGTGTTVYYNFYHSEDTTAEQIQAAQNASEFDRLSGGYR